MSIILIVLGAISGSCCVEWNSYLSALRRKRRTTSDEKWLLSKAGLVNVIIGTIVGSLTAYALTITEAIDKSILLSIPAGAFPLQVVRLLYKIQFSKDADTITAKKKPTVRTRSPQDEQDDVSSMLDSNEIQAATFKEAYSEMLFN